MRRPTSRHVIPTADGRWVVKAPNTRQTVKYHTEQQAIAAAKRIVQDEGGGEVRIYRKDGRIRERVAVPARAEPLASEGTIGEQTFAASVWQEGEWFVAQALEIDVASHGQTVESALANLREALELHFELPTPTVSPQVHCIRVKVGAA